MSTVHAEKQQESVQSNKPRLMKPFEAFLLIVALLLLFFELFTTFNHNLFFSEVSNLREKWSYAEANHLTLKHLPSMREKLSQMEASHYGPVPASWFPRIDGLDAQLDQMEKETNKVWAKLTAKKKAQAMEALSQLKETEGAYYKQESGKYQAALKQAQEPQDFEKLTKKWTDLNKKWIQSEASLKKVSGGFVDQHPADIVLAKQKLENVLKLIHSNAPDKALAERTLGKIEDYFELTPPEQLNQHAAIMKEIAATTSQLKEDETPHRIDVPLINQMADPELYNGCEVTSLAMILQYAGYDVTKNQLADQIPKVPVQYENGLMGDPNKGFVGDIDGSSPGYFVYHGPLAALAKKYAGSRVQDLTGEHLSEIYKKLAEGLPVLVYTTTSFTPQTMETWKTPDGKVPVSLEEHCVVLTGYSKKYVWLNNPYGQKDEKVDRKEFEQSWIQLGRQAIVINPPSGSDRMQP